MANDLELISLNCFLCGQTGDRVFSVHILNTANVSDLKDLIKKTVDLDHVPKAYYLDLWKVELPVDRITPEITIKDIENPQKLSPVKKISSVFPQNPEDECVHIFVQLPPAFQLVPALDPTQIITLYCLVLGDNLNEIFHIDILKTKTVSHLKILIKEQKAHDLAHVDVSKLILSQVSLPVDGDLEENLKKIALLSLNPIQPILELAHLVEPNRLNIVVQAPSKGNPGKRNHIMALDQKFRILISRILNSAKSSSYPKSSISYAIHDGRYKAGNPRTSVAPPIQLFNPAFGHFLDELRSNSPIPDDIIRQTTAYMKFASAAYEAEDKRRKALRPLLCKILGVDIQTIVSEDKSNPDDITGALLDLQEIEARVLLLLDKNEFGDGGTDPSTQAGLFASLYWVQPKFETLRNATSCPTFLIATAGPWIVILGFVITDDIIIQRLTDYIWVGLDSTQCESHVARVARVLYALKTGLEKLRSYYANLNLTGEKVLAPSRYFPSVTAYPSNKGEPIEFDYIGYLEDGSDCSTLHAQTRTPTAQDIVVKFVDRYGSRAHSLLADNGLAPKLLYCGTPHIKDGEPSYQSLIMVIMEYVDGDTFAVAKPKMAEKEIIRVQSDVKRALQLLHTNGLVFGDLRRPNVMIRKDGQAQLIDFDWAGEKGHVKYPSLISPEIAWPVGVEALSLITEEHDLNMANRL